MINTVILDFDGTIGDTCGLIVRTMQQTLDAVGLPMQSDAQCAAMIGLPLRQCFSQLMPMDDVTAARCESTYREIFARNNADYKVQVFPNVVETIKQLHNSGMKICIASSRSRHSLLAFLDDMALDGYVEIVVAANDVEHPKPAPDMIIRILGETGSRADEAIMVGDTRYDIDMGRAAGAVTCAVTYGNGQIEELGEADYRISDFSQLAGIISKLNS